MGTNILAGQTLVAGQAAGDLSQYYGQADAVQTTVTVASFTNLSSQYTIPAGEAYAGAAYELECAGYGTQGSTTEAMYLQMAMNGSGFGNAPVIGGSTWNASEAFAFWLKMRLVCSDGVSAWWASLSGVVAETAGNIIPGTTGAYTYAIAATNTGTHTASVSSANSIAIQFHWAAVTGSPTITNTMTTFKKVA